jgi:hypothetical protein
MTDKLDHDAMTKKKKPEGWGSWQRFVKYPSVRGLYSRQAIEDMMRKKEMKKTGDWEKLIRYLKE